MPDLTILKEYEDLGKSKNSNIYPNTKNYTLEQLWKKIKEVIENA